MILTWTELGDQQKNDAKSKTGFGVDEQGNT